MPNPVDDPALNRPQARSRPRRWLWRILIALVVLFLAAELFTRFILGLGDPPLMMTDPEMEYIFAPSQDVRRIGNRIRYNAFSMRADEFTAQKTDPREVRVMFYGDSVINGGALTDQADVASEILKRRISSALSRPVVVGNASASSWGPSNLLAYVKRFGFFGADVVVLVFSSHDYADVMKFEPVVGVHLGFPDRKPPLALQELIVRYLWPRIMGAAMGEAGTPTFAPPTEQEIDTSLSALRELIGRARETGAAVIFAHHFTPDEAAGKVDAGRERILRAAREAGATVVEMGPAEKAALESGQNPWRDIIHPNDVGQRIIADELYEPILAAISSRSTTGSTTQPAPKP